MPVKPNFLERTAFFSLNAAPIPILDLAGAISYQALSTAIRLEIFPALQEKPSSALDLAEKLGLQQRGVKKLLKALEAVGYVTDNGGLYSNSKATQKWFFESEIIDLHSLTSAFDVFFQKLWPHAPAIIQSGERPFDFYQFVTSDPLLSDAFQKTMIGNANIIGPDVVKIIDLREQETKLLDIGGGHGKFTIQFCQAYPGLRGTIIDNAVALQTAARFVKEAGFQDRIELIPGDIWEIAWGGNFDLVLLFNFIHHYGPATNLELLKKTFAALKPGGKVAILDQFEGTVSGSATNAVVQLVSLMYYVFADGRTYSSEEIRELLNESGFKEIKFHTAAKWSGTSLAVAEK